ncbi:MAG: hypothetical protein AAGE52_07475 [Myxococcota bacterium]
MRSGRGSRGQGSRLLPLIAVIACSAQPRALVRQQSSVDAATDAADAGIEDLCPPLQEFPLAGPSQLSFLAPSTRDASGLTWVDPAGTRHLAEFDARGQELPGRVTLGGELDVFFPFLAARSEGGGWWVAFHNHRRAGKWRVYLTQTEAGVSPDRIVENSAAISPPDAPESQRPIMLHRSGDLLVTYREDASVVLVSLDADGNERLRGSQDLGAINPWPRVLFPLANGDTFVSVRNSLRPEPHRYRHLHFDRDHQFVATVLDERVLASDETLTEDGMIAATVDEEAPGTLRLRWFAQDGSPSREANVDVGEPVSEVEVAAGNGLGVLARVEGGLRYLRLGPNGDVRSRALVHEGDADRLSLAPTADGEFLLAWSDPSRTPPTAFVASCPR